MRCPLMARQGACCCLPRCPTESCLTPEIVPLLLPAWLQLLCLTVKEAHAALCLSKKNFSQLLRDNGFKRWPSRQLAALSNLRDSVCADASLFEATRQVRPPPPAVCEWVCLGMGLLHQPYLARKTCRPAHTSHTCCTCSSCN